MKLRTRVMALAGFVACCAMIPSDVSAGRFGGGGGGGRGGGGFGGGGFAAPVARPAAPAVHANPVQSGTVHGAYGGTMTGSRQTGSVSGAYGGSGTVGRQGGTYTGPRGGQGAAGARGGSYTTGGGTTVTGGSHGGAYTGPRGTTVVHGGSAGTVTGPGGNTAGGAKHGTVVVGPNGNVHATGGKAGVATGPGGTVAGASRGSVTAGPGGVAASGGRVVAGTGPGGTAVAGSRGAVAVGPHGAVAAGGRAVAGTGTHWVHASTLPAQGVYVRRSFGYYNCFNRGWYAKYPGAWFAAGLATAAVWNAATWSGASSSCGYPPDTAPYAYDYGDTLTVQDGNVMFGDNSAGTEAQYAQQATEIADAGRDAKPPENEKWDPLGVFAMVKGEEESSDNIFQLAMNKDGVVRGNYYNALTDTTQPVYGSLDKKTQRVAWSVGDKKENVFEAGLYNLTQPQTTMLAHFGKDRTEQYSLFRIEQPKDDGSKPKDGGSNPSQ